MRPAREDDLEFGLIYLQASKRLLVFGGEGVERATAVKAFLLACPELMPFSTGSYGHRYGV